MNVKVVATSFRKQGLEFIADPQWLIPSIILPFLFAATVLMMYPDRTESVMLQAILGGGVLGIWGNTLASSAFSLSYDRMNGTLEGLLISPSEMFDVITGRCLWNSFIGLANMVLVFVFVTLMFHQPVGLVNPAGFVVVMILLLLSLSSIGVLLSAAFVYTRRGYLITSIFEYPIYFFSGAVVPVSALPSWCAPVSYALAPAWAVDALRETAIAGYSSDFGFGLVGNVIVCLALSAVLLVVGYFALKKIVANVRETGSFTRY